MLYRTACMTVAMIMIAGLSGCESLLQENWGRSYETALHQQILNPQAEQNLAPVEGLDGPSAERNMEQYQKGEKQDKKSSSSIGVLTVQK